MNKCERMIGQVNRCFNAFKNRFDVPDYIEGVSDITENFESDYIFNLRVKKRFQWREDEHVQLVYNRDSIETWLENSSLFEFVSHGKTE